MNKLLRQYFDRTKTGRLDYLRQLIFITFAPLSVILFALHLFGSYGLDVWPALACSACFIGVTLAASCLYLLKGPETLNRILPPHLTILTMIQCARLIFLARMAQEQPMLTTVNIAVCYIIVFVACMSLLPRAALVCTVLNIGAIAACGALTGNGMYWQLLTVFGTLQLATSAFCFVSDRLLLEQRTEMDGYANTIEQILHAFNMSRTELLSILQIANAGGTQAIYDREHMEHLSHNTVRNIKNAASQIEQMQTEQRLATQQRFPTLSPTELDVCRLVQQGLTLKDIAAALGKSISNVSTVRGNIRKKLQLSQDEDLRSFLLGKQ